MKMKLVKYTKVVDAGEKETSQGPTSQKLLKIRKTKQKLITNAIKDQKTMIEATEEDNSNRAFYSHMNTSTTMEQEAQRRRAAAMQEDLIRQTSTEVIDGSASHLKSRDNSNLKSRGSIQPFATENSHEVIEPNFANAYSGENLQPFSQNVNPLTNSRNSQNNYLTSQVPSRKAGLITAQFPAGDSDKARVKMLTYSDDKYNSHKRNSSKYRKSEMCFISPNASPPPNASP